MLQSQCTYFSDAGSFGQHSFDDVETKSRFTSYTMTSSVMQRNEGLTLLDDRFEKVITASIAKSIQHVPEKMPKG